jgi:3-deoxy-D-manno-octulosonic-acid transferase
MYALYTLLLLLGGLGLLPHILWRGLRGATYHQELAQRFAVGIVSPEMTQAVRGCVWFHAASVGEVQGIRPIIASVHHCRPELPIVLSAFTPAGKQMAQRLVPEAAVVFVLPLDFPWLIRRLLRRLRPCALLVQETELWPNLFRAAARQHVPVVLVNGRLSARAFRRYQWVRPLMRRVLANVTLLLVQSEEGARRLHHLGADPSRIHVTGNTNIDRALMATTQPTSAHPLAPLVRDRRLLVAGSTHEGEETVLLAVYRRLYVHYPDLVLVLAPRHLERVATVLHHVHTFGCQALRRSQCQQWQAQDDSGPTVIVLDTMGELPALYSLCTVAFVGGSLVPIGGHNVLEPAVFAKPLCFGPYMDHFPELVALLRQADAAVQVQGAEELYVHLERLLAHPEEGDAMGQRALHALAANRGALARTTSLLEALLSPGAAHG